MPSLTYVSHLQLMNWMRGVDAAAPSELYVGLLTAAPTPAGTNISEPSGNYARQLVTFGEPTSAYGISEMMNTNAVIFPAASVDWAQITYLGIFSGDGDLLFYGTPAVPRLIKSGDTMAFAVNAIKLRLK